MTLTRPMIQRPPIGSLSRAAFKFAGALIRRMRVIPDSANWQQRAELCERCPMRVVKCGVSYCGKPFLKQPLRDTAIDGCGCPTRAKAKDPAEHCPVSQRYTAAVRSGAACDCKWCRLAARA